MQIIDIKLLKLKNEDNSEAGLQREGRVLFIYYPIHSQFCYLRHHHKTLPNPSPRAGATTAAHATAAAPRARRPASTSSPPQPPLPPHPRTRSTPTRDQEASPVLWRSFARTAAVVKSNIRAKKLPKFTTKLPKVTKKLPNSKTHSGLFYDHSDPKFSTSERNLSYPKNVHTSF